MAEPLVLAHISDLHVSTFGDTFHDRAGAVKRSAEPLPGQGDRPEGQQAGRFDLCWEEAGWRVLSLRGARRKRLVLVDPDGYVHPIPSARAAKVRDPVERAQARARLLEARRAITLARALPGESELTAMLAETPKNTNLRFLRAARAVEAAGVDLVLITGDLTDNGDGYELIQAVFQARQARGRVLAIPGNHDLYLFPLAGSSRPRATHKSKRQRWREFAGWLGLDLDDTGAWSVPFPESSAIVVGLDSCAHPQRRFFRHNGAIGGAQLEYLRRLSRSAEWRDARHRVVALHHHVVPLAHGVGRRAPTEIGMRLDDAREVAAVLSEVGATLVMHGHRHISEGRHPAGCNFRLLAAPSLTLGCKSGDAPSFWRIELGRSVDTTRVRVPVAGVPQDSDPGPDEAP